VPNCYEKISAVSQIAGEDKFSQTFSPNVFEKYDFWQTRMNANETHAFQCSPETNQQNFLFQILEPLK
jgi:hypothetical protein